MNATPSAAALDTCIDASAMRALLQCALPGCAEGRWRIDALRVLKARRSTSLRRHPHPIVACYELSLRDAERGEQRRQLLYAKVFRDGASAACFRAIDTARLVRPACGEPVAHLPELDMVLWALPNDPGLPQLAEMLDPARLRARLPWAALDIDAQRLRELGVELLRYEPEQRATLRCTLTLAGAAEPLVLYAKTFADDRGHAINARFAHFWTVAQRDPAAPQVAQPLGYDAATHTAWQAAARGVPLAETLATGDAVALLGQVAHALAAVHAAPLSSPRQRPIAHWLAEARRRRTKIARAEPQLAARAGALVETLEAQAARLPPCALGLIHGDFHPEQIWLHEGRIVLFDFDEFTLGDPMEDLAEFAATLDAAGRPEAQAAAWARCFVDAYALCAAGNFDARRLQWHLALQQLLQATRAFVFQRPGWQLELERRLARAEAFAADLASGEIR